MWLVFFFHSYVDGLKHAEPSLISIWIEKLFRDVKIIEILEEIRVCE